MRKLYAAAFVTAVALVAASGLAYADPFPDSGETDTAQSTSASTVVTLPTGDKVVVPARGPLAQVGKTTDALRTRLANGDRVLIPYEALSSVHSGEKDARLFNVDALVRNGYTDARKVTSPSKLGKAFMDGRASRAKAGTKVTFKPTWVDGSAPQGINGTWVNLKTGKGDYLGGDGSTTSVKLAPGKYSFSLNVIKPRGSTMDAITTVVDLKVTDKPATVKVDGSKAKPMGFKVDAADAKPQSQGLSSFVASANGEGWFGSGGLFGGETKLYGIPSKKITGHQAGYTVQTELAAPTNASTQYSYSLFDAQPNGVPGKLTKTVHDNELAKREMTYNSLGANTTVDRANAVYSAITEADEVLPNAPVKVPSQRTEFYTASPEVSWDHVGAMDYDQNSGLDMVGHHSGPMSPGQDTMSWMSAPLSVGLPAGSDEATPATMMRFPYDGGADSSPELWLSPPLFDSGATGETMSSFSLSGKAVISKGGKTLGTSDDGGMVLADLPKNDKGRYTVTFDGKRDVKWTPLGTRSTAKWEFDSAPARKPTPLGLSTVVFNASGITDGYADASKPQDVTLDYMTQTGAPDRDCAALTFQVSYDDGKTWKKVKLDRDGDKATAQLKHQNGAKFVSVKFTAKDDKGQTVRTSTLRSYGLR